MALRDHMLARLWGYKPSAPSANGTAAAFAIGDRVFQQNGINPHLVRAVRLSIENERKAKAKKALAGH